MTAVVRVEKNGTTIGTRQVDLNKPGEIEKAVSDIFAEIRKRGETIWDVNVRVTES